MRPMPLLALLAASGLAACDNPTPEEPLLHAAVSQRSLAGSLTASPVSSAEIELAWLPATGMVSGYELYRSTTGQTGGYSSLATTSATSYADPSLAPATVYCYEVRSFRSTNHKITYSSFSPPACATTQAAPPPVSTVNPPGGVDAVPARDEYYVDQYNAEIRVSWVDNSDNEAGFRIERAGSLTGPWTQVASAAANGTVAFTGASREVMTCFRVTAFNSQAASTPSTADCTIPPANPTNLAARPTSDSRALLLTWADNSAAEDGYRIYRLEGTSTWTELATLPANSTSYVDAAVVTDVPYTYRVVATRDGGSSDDSNLADGVIPTSLPAAPTLAWASLDSYNDGYGWVYLGVNWTDNASNEQGFRIEWSDDGVSSWRTSGTVGANATGYGEKWDIFTSFGTGECYRIIAFNSMGDSRPSNVACAEWGVAPMDAAAEAVGADAIALSWRDIARFEAGYEILRATSENGEYRIVAELPANSASYTDAGLASGTQYWYLIATIDEYVPYDASNVTIVTATTNSTSAMSALRPTTRQLDRATVAKVRATILGTRTAHARRAMP